MADHEAVTKSNLLNSTSYDIIKDGVTIVFPAAVTLYAGLAVVWGWGFSEEVVVTGGLLGIFFGIVLKVASKRYAEQPVDYNGALLVNMADPNKDNYKLEIDQPWDQLAALDEVRIKVVEQS